MYLLASKGIIKIGDLITKDDRINTTSNLIELNFSPMDAFELMTFMDAIPPKWRWSLKLKGFANKPVFDPQNEM